MISPDFSIIIPHNNSCIENDPLLPTLASIADQEGVIVELLLQHGGGIPGLWGKLSRALNLSEKKDHVILRVIEEKSSSPEEALAAGVKRATGSWIGFVKPGEQYLPETLIALKSALEANPSTNIFLTGSVILAKNKLLVAPAVLPTIGFLKNWEHPWSHEIFFRSSLFQKEIILKPQYEHQMITDAFLCLLEKGEKIKTLPLVTTLTLLKKEKKESLLPKPIGMIALLKPWYQWRHQAALRSAQKATTLPNSILIYQDSLARRTSMKYSG